MSTGRTVIPPGPCPIPGCSPHILNVDKHLKAHKDLKKAAAIAALASLRASNPDPPMQTHLDVADPGESASEVERCQTCKTNKRKNRNRTAQVKRLKRQVADLLRASCAVTGRRSSHPPRSPNSSHHRSSSPSRSLRSGSPSRYPRRTQRSPNSSHHPSCSPSNGSHLRGAPAAAAGGQEEAAFWGCNGYPAFLRKIGLAPTTIILYVGQAISFMEYFRATPPKHSRITSGQTKVVIRELRKLHRDLGRTVLGHQSLVKQAKGQKLVAREKIEDIEKAPPEDPKTIYRFFGYLAAYLFSIYGHRTGLGAQDGEEIWDGPGVPGGGGVRVVPHLALTMLRLKGAPSLMDIRTAVTSKATTLKFDKTCRTSCVTVWTRRMQDLSVCLAMRDPECAPAAAPPAAAEEEKKARQRSGRSPFPPLEEGQGEGFKLHALGYQPVLFLSHPDWKGQIIRDIIHHVDPAEGVVPGILIKMRKLYECMLKMAKCVVTPGSLQNDMQSCKPAHRIITKVQHGACS
ncbi:hypothetical protein GBF38_022179 [Nibea albiflora]|uniref:Uncharacterized protein n=1 Tax=Nibea albiflora TaxID=240163 RepID=A0ACB7FIK2_NIBAL|nr:hypothetical protein GBF38_022179 [Nibea albiflora]